MISRLSQMWLPDEMMSTPALNISFAVSQGQAAAGGRVLAVGDDDVDAELVPQTPGSKAARRLTPWLPHHVSDKEDPHSD